MEQTSTQLGAYRLYEKIGGGGFATVYVARDTRTNEMVAIKILHSHFAQDAQFIARFRREAEALQKIPPHPNIVRLREWGRQGDTYYLVTDFLEGKDLSRILAERKCLSVNEALSIAMQIAQALDAAHRHGLVHRDIKPSNIKVTPQGVVKVMDFGIARAAEGTKLTQTGTFMGTPDYIAPEVWEGKPADIRSDLYALGAILYEMLTGISPFHADTPAATMRRHLTEQLPPLRTVRADISPNVEQWLATLLAKQPEARYQTPGELLAAMYAGQASALAEQPRQDVPTIRVQTTRQGKNNVLAPILVIIIGGMILLVVLMVALAFRESTVAHAPAVTTIPISTTIRPINTPSATSIATATILPTAISTSTPDFTETAQVRASTTVQAQATATTQPVRSATTAAATTQADATVTAQAASVATQNAIIAYVDALVAKAGRPLREREGQLTGSQSFWVNGMWKNFVIDVEFFNPADPAIHSWDYGFRFRYAGATRFFILSLDSKGLWRLAAFERAAADHHIVKTIGSGRIASMDLRSTGANKVRFVAYESSGFLYVNGTFVSLMDLSTNLAAGDLHLRAGMWVGNDFPGMSVIFKNLSVAGLP